MNIEDIPRVQLGNLPTSVDSLPRISAHLNCPRIKVKRDDLTGLALGGTKVRKMEYLLADAIRQGARTIVTAGPNHSNHCRLAAAAAARCGLDCVLILSSKDPQHEDEKPPSANTFMDHLFGAEIIWTLKESRDAALFTQYEELKKNGRRPYMFPNTDTHPLSVIGYALAIREIMGQGQHPDWIVFSSSTGGTQAGLLLGKQLFGFRGQILGINASSSSEWLTGSIDRALSAACEYLGVKNLVNRDDMLVDEHYLGQGYAVVNDMDIEAVRLFARLEGLLLDPVYTGRAAAGLIDLIRQGKFSPEEEVLFWHTGGTPILLTQQYQEHFCGG